MVGLIFGCIVLFLDLIVFCIFLSRVQQSYNKKNYLDDEFSQNNDDFLKLSRVSGALFSLFHIGIMAILITESISNILANNNGVAHIYWLLQSLWILLSNLAIVLITQRMFRVYKTTSTPFTPLRDWIWSHQKLIEYVVWSIYILITLLVFIQYIIIISSEPNEYHKISLINAIRSFFTAIILCLQLVIACFFFFIAHKSQQQTNWNEQSKSIICKETAKLAFIVIFLALIVAVILYMAIWYLVHLNIEYALNAPFNDTNDRIFWSILEFLGFWLISYLTRLRKVKTDKDYIDDKTFSFKRTLSMKQKKEEYKKQKIEERKRAFQERERKRLKIKNINTTKQETNYNTKKEVDVFNKLFIKQVAKYEKEKKVKHSKQALLAQLKEKYEEQNHHKNKRRNQVFTLNPNLFRFIICIYSYLIYTERSFVTFGLRIIFNQQSS